MQVSALSAGPRGAGRGTGVRGLRRGRGGGGGARAAQVPQVRTQLVTGCGPAPRALSSLTPTLAVSSSWHGLRLDFGASGSGLSPLLFSPESPHLWAACYFSPCCSLWLTFLRQASVRVCEREMNPIICHVSVHVCV